MKKACIFSLLLTVGSVFTTGQKSHTVNIVYLSKFLASKEAPNNASVASLVSSSMSSLAAQAHSDRAEIFAYIKEHKPAYGTLIVLRNQVFKVTKEQ